MLQNPENISSNPQTICSNRSESICSFYIPTFWALVILLSPRITKFCGKHIKIKYYNLININPVPVTNPDGG